MTIRPATSSVPVVAGLFAAAAVAWLVVAVQAGGMESAPGTMGLGAAAFPDRNESAAAWVGAALLVGAGAYQLSPLKDRCLAVPMTMESL